MTTQVVPVLEIPVTPRPQTFNITLRGVIYTFRLWWMKPAGCWVFDIADLEGNPIINGLPLVTGTNLLEQYPHIGPAGGLWVVNSDTSTRPHEPDRPPTFRSLGVTGHIYYKPPVSNA